MKQIIELEKIQHSAISEILIYGAKNGDNSLWVSLTHKIDVHFTASLNDLFLTLKFLK